MVSKNLLAALTLSLTSVNAIYPIHIKNYRFIKPASSDNDVSENEIFFMNGIDYQPGGSSGYDPDSTNDVLSDPDICARDAFAFQQLGINTVRIYTLNPDVNHDECMTILNDAGIYVVLDVNSGNDGENLNRADPSGSYNSQYLTRVFKFIEAFKNYPNVLGFISGNEVINDEEDYAEIDPAYVRAVQRDMKQYIAKNADRPIPVGYAAANQVDLRLATFKYLQCNSLDGKTVNSDLDTSRSDFFGLNTYDWCSGQSDWTTSGYDKLNSTFSDAVIPLVFSEYGCNANSPRTFDEVTEGLYGGLVNLFSGGLVYEYAQEANNYGLVQIDDDDNSISYLEDFTNLQDKIKDISLPSTKESQVAGRSIYKCDANAIKKIYSNFGTSNFTIPKQPADISKMIKNGLNATNVGSILSDYTPPSTLKYNVKDTDGNDVSATLSYDPSNTLNNVKLAATSSVISNVTFSNTTSKSSSSISKSSGISSSKSKSTGKSSKVIKSASKSVSNSTKLSKGDATNLKFNNNGSFFFMVVTALFALII
ncbi:hypothetical protein TBLA_0D01120 [Henningerozyma blattae CBS 6284]|uniref:1,3-beta-glucanosyltransferase n=1 Tax=Henningerozyma blattae (strain ATCC 34711 / CBS 6284 / DSM 70876 / NBRC 10599 / NRRL Y-10934 / UCD 77-7) TaxID=1071380 RepID=I2H2L8_HENB6|nr:hypothetical protein TBLA_0D01120 [Tetrapisispora blattae CBS 6284]CCH60620.1 hypothetical protein TBLA_0D01120 [Tetrapisispora blattae CBS 6284]